MLEAPANVQGLGMGALDPVERCWVDLTSRWGCDGPAAAATLAELARAYGEPHRHYHTLDHIAALLALAAQCGGEVEDRDALVLAILFHDAVYDPTRTDNEAASASLAAKRLTQMGLPPNLAAKVTRYILATRHDAPPPDAGAEPDLALLLDLDLSILAAAPDAYRAYAQAVRREFAFVPDPLYRAGRRRVLDGFLARERIYLTEPAHPAWEASARANIAAEIAELT